MAKTIEVVVNTGGEIKIDAVGFKGADCERATAFLEKALGNVKGRTKKPEYHQRAQTRQRLGG
jgi:hypothetical protein